MGMGLNMLKGTQKKSAAPHTASVGMNANLPINRGRFGGMFGAPSLGSGNPTPSAGEKVFTARPWVSGTGAGGSGGSGKHDVGT